MDVEAGNTYFICAALNYFLDMSISWWARQFENLLAAQFHTGRNTPPSHLPTKSNNEENPRKQSKLGHLQDQKEVLENEQYT